MTKVKSALSSMPADNERTVDNFSPLDAKLVAESWCRVVGGSGQRHEITPAGSRLVEEGFV